MCDITTFTLRSNSSHAHIGNVNKLAICEKRHAIHSKRSLGQATKLRFLIWFGTKEKSGLNARLSLGFIVCSYQMPITIESLNTQQILSNGVSTVKMFTFDNITVGKLISCTRCFIKYWTPKLFTCSRYTKLYPITESSWWIVWKSKKMPKNGFREHWMIQSQKYF